MKPSVEPTLRIQRSLVKISNERHADPNHVFLQFAFERFLYRLSISGHADSLVKPVNVSGHSCPIRLKISPISIHHGNESTLGMCYDRVDMARSADRFIPA